MELPHSPDARPVYVQVILVGALHHTLGTHFFSGCQQVGEQIFLADVAAIRRIVLNTLLASLIHLQHNMLCPQLGRRLSGILQFPVGMQLGGKGHRPDGYASCLPRITGHFQQKAAVHTCGKRNADAFLYVIRHPLFEIFFFLS